MACRVLARYGLAGRGRHGKARRDWSWQGAAGHGVAGMGLIAAVLTGWLAFAAIAALVIARVIRLRDRT